MSERNNREIVMGTVKSNKMDKTIVVENVTYVMHPLYGKRIKHTRLLKAHDEKNECNIGDRVKVMATRPLSKHKRHRLMYILERAK